MLHFYCILYFSFCAVACLSNNHICGVLYHFSPCCPTSPTVRNNCIATKLGHAPSPSTCLLACVGLLSPYKHQATQRAGKLGHLASRAMAGSGEGREGKQAGEGKVTLSTAKKTFVQNTNLVLIFKCLRIFFFFLLL